MEKNVYNYETKKMKKGGNKYSFNVKIKLFFLLFIHKNNRKKYDS